MTLIPDQARFTDVAFKLAWKVSGVLVPVTADGWTPAIVDKTDNAAFAPIVEILEEAATPTKPATNLILRVPWHASMPTGLVSARIQMTRAGFPDEDTGLLPITWRYV